MKVAILLITVALVQVSAASFGQRVSIDMHNVPLEKALLEIKQQTGYNMLYTLEILSKSKPISIKVRNNDILKTLDQLFDGQPLEYVIKEHTVVVKEKTPSFLDRTVSVIQSAARDLFSAIDISGLVLDEKGLPLAGVTVRVKGTNKATSTGNDGKFYLAGVDDDAVIEFRMVGYKVLELSAKGKFDGVRMEILSKELEEVVVAYGKTTQQALTGAVTVVKGEQIANLPSRSFDKSLQGLVPGLQITGGTGQPGGGVANMVLRGIATGADVSNGITTRNPLFVIDGIPVSQESFQFQRTSDVTPYSNPLAQLNPSDIETISVLKDAAAIALYGSKASNGVILVTTKKGKLGKTVFGFQHQTDFSSRLPGKTKVLNREQYLGLLYDTFKNTPRVIGGVSTPWTDANILADLKTKFPTKADGTFYATPDWYSELFTDNASTISNNLNMSGGNDKSNFYLNVEYTKQNGAVKKTGYDRKSMRFNFESRPASWLKLGTNTNLSYNIQDYSNASEGTSGLSTATIISPLNPVRLENGNYQFFYPFGMVGSTAQNPVAAAEYNLSRNATYRALSKVYSELNLFKYLTFKSDLGVDFMLAEMKERIDPRFYTGSSSTLPRISELNDRRGNIINTNSIRFDKTIEDNHTLSLFAGQEAQIITTKLLGADAAGTGETLPYYELLTSPGYTMSKITGASSRQTLLSVFGQANYGYMNKYFLSGSIRKDGSSKFGNQSQWGTYWSAGAGWVASEEKFLKNNTFGVDYLKIRGSIGAAGNSTAIDAFTRFDQLVLRKFMGNSVFSTAVLGNPNIRWEETFTWDAGLELRLLKERISFAIDIYNRKTHNLIYITNLPTITGFATVLDNIGDMKNQGIELSISSTIIRSNRFNWILNANWSTNQNKLVKANVPLASISGNLLANEEGRNFNSFYMPVWMGVNQEDGKPQWMDANGLPTSTYSLAKKEFVGKPQPDGYGAITNTFRYKSFELSAQLYYQHGLVIYNSTLARVYLTDGVVPYVNQVVEALDYWKNPGDVAANPKRVLNNPDAANRESTRYLFKGDYIRLQNVMFNYTFSKSAIGRLPINSLKIYVQGHNLALLTKYKGPDPDNANVGGSTGFAYPNSRSFSAGLNVTF